MTSPAWMLPAKFLADALEQPFRAGALDLDLDAGIFCLERLASFSPTGRSIEEYSTTLPSLRAASSSAGVIDTGSGAAARDGAANTVGRVPPSP